MLEVPILYTDMGLGVFRVYGLGTWVHGLGFLGFRVEEHGFRGMNIYNMG